MISAKVEFVSCYIKKEIWIFVGSWSYTFELSLAFYFLSIIDKNCRKELVEFTIPT